MKILVYKATFPDGKSYVGVTCKSLKRRITQHRSDAKRGSYYRFHEALRVYGLDSPKWEILSEEMSFDCAKDKEMEFIKKFKTKENGFNSTYGGQGTLRGRMSDSQRMGLAEKRGTAKTFYVHDLKGNFVKKFDSIVECVLYFEKVGLDMDIRNVWACLKGQRRCGYGHVFSYGKKFELKPRKRRKDYGTKKI